MNGSPTATRDDTLYAAVAIGLGLVAVGVVVEPVLGWAGLLVGAVFGLTIAIGEAVSTTWRWSPG